MLRDPSRCRRRVRRARRGPADPRGDGPVRPRAVGDRGTRRSTATVRCFPLVENTHRDGILRVSRAPAPDLDPATQAARRGDRPGAARRPRLRRGARRSSCSTSDGELLANEIAPRVHNSGHWTIEGAETSQFEQHLRAVLGWPLGSPAARGHAAMLNAIGALPPREAVLAVPGARLHDYGKAAASRPQGRPRDRRRRHRRRARGATRAAPRDRARNPRLTRQPHRFGAAWHRRAHRRRQKVVAGLRDGAGRFQGGDLVGREPVLGEHLVGVLARAAHAGAGSRPASARSAAPAPAGARRRTRRWSRGPGCAGAARPRSSAAPARSTRRCPRARRTTRRASWSGTAR